MSGRDFGILYYGAGLLALLLKATHMFIYIYSLAKQFLLILASSLSTARVR